MHIYDKFTSINSYNYDFFYNTIQDQRNTKTYNELKNEYTKISLEQFNNLIDIPNNCSIFINDWQFDIFFNFLTSEKLYIILSGSRTDKDPLPLYKRWSWNTAFDGSTLYLADPMFYKYKNCKLGWYYGSKEFNIYTYIQQIINIVQKKYNFKNIIFYGSSGGGFAALQSSVYYNNSCAITINPQIYINNYPYAKYFTQHTGIDLNKPDEFNRNNLDLLLKKSKSKILIIQNDSDRHDCEIQLFPLLKKYKILPKYGLQRKENLYVWIYHAYGGHNAQEDMHILQFVLFLSDIIFNKKYISDWENKLSIAVNEIWAQLHWLKHTSKK